MTGRDDRLRALKKAHGAVQTGPTPRVEDYVEVIYELILERGAAQVVDISAHLSVSSPTASKMMQKLADDGLVIYERYRAIALTDAGTQLAKRVRQRHDIVMDFLRLLGVDDTAAHRATEGIEHHLEPATLDRLAKLVAYAKEHPDWWKEQDRAQR
ncbi:MAG TPA: transcriptional regulator MntR [Candidatus Thermoplasmatota archaeon]|nr:transcriptional regulator MntR [Candidatus Thermoplasmatota archaeon]